MIISNIFDIFMEGIIHLVRVQKFPKKVKLPSDTHTNFFPDTRRWRHARLHIQGLCRVWGMSDYGSICHNNAWTCLHVSCCPSICLNMTGYCWISLNVPENAWIKYPMPGVSICPDKLIITLLLQLMLLYKNSCLLDLYMQAFCYHFFSLKPVRT